MSTMEKTGLLPRLAAWIRYDILVSTTQAGSGHPTSSLSATELMAGLLFGGAFRFDVDHPEHPNNDRLIFSKGHASPLLLRAVGGGGRGDGGGADDLAAVRQPAGGPPDAALPLSPRRRPARSGRGSRSGSAWR